MSPVLIAISSLFPGLGFLFLGKWKSALLTWLFLAPFLVLLPATIQLDSFRCLYPIAAWTLIIWSNQLVRAYKLAKINDQLRRKEIELLNKANIQSISFDQKHSFLQRDYIIMGKRLESHLLEGEELTAWVMGERNIRTTLWGDQVYCVGLLNSYLLIGEFGAFDFPETVRRVRRERVQLFSGVRNGNSLLWLALEDYEKGKKSIVITVNFQLSQSLKKFNEHAHTMPLFK